MSPQPEIKTERLLLRRLEESDWEIISYLRSDKTVNQFVKRKNADTKTKALKFIRKANKNIDNGVLYNWGISEINRPEIIGTICLWNFSEDRKTAELGYDLSPAFHKKGMMDEALKAVITFGFHQLILEEIEAFTQKNNDTSRKLLERNYFEWNEARNDEDNELNVIYELNRKTFLSKF